MDKQTRLKNFSKWVIVLGVYLFSFQLVVAQSGRLEGVITDKEARAKKIGGEVLAYVW